MRLRILSDLHLGRRNYRTPVDRRTSCDVVVLAGDIGELPAVEWAARRFPDTPVVYVLGITNITVGWLPSG